MAGSQIPPPSVTRHLAKILRLENFGSLKFYANTPSIFNLIFANFFDFTTSYKAETLSVFVFLYFRDVASMLPHMLTSLMESVDASRWQKVPKYTIRDSEKS